MTAMSTEAPTDATKELRASVSMGVPRHTLWATPTVAIHAAFTGLHVLYSRSHGTPNFAPLHFHEV